MINDQTCVQWHCRSLKYRHAPNPLFQDLHFTLPLTQFTCLLGKSGCGKSTLLRFLSGLLKEDIDWQGELHSPIPLSNNIAYMGQQDLLLPWLNVRDNAALQAKFDKTGAISDRTIDDVLAQLGLSHVADWTPEQLSGGMRQRVALARTLLQNKPFVFMDEPFSALDAITRQALQRLTVEKLKQKTVLLITHDPLEALQLANRIIVMDEKTHHMHTLVLNDLPPRTLNATLLRHQQTLLTWLHSDEAKYAYVD